MRYSGRYGHTHRRATLSRGYNVAPARYNRVRKNREFFWDDPILANFVSTTFLAQVQALYFLNFRGGGANASFRHFHLRLFRSVTLGSSLP